MGGGNIVGRDPWLETGMKKIADYVKHGSTSRASVLIVIRNNKYLCQLSDAARLAQCGHMRQDLGKKKKFG